MIRPTYKRKIMKIGNAGVMLYKTDTGFDHLRCSCMPFQKKGWCTHLEKVLSDRQDSDSLGIVPSVPLFKEPLLSVPVAVIEKSEDLFEVKLLWGNVSVKGDTIKADGHEVVGYITHGEGRMDIRALVFSFLRSAYLRLPNDQFKCGSPFHVEGRNTFDIISPDIEGAANMLANPPSPTHGKQIIADTYHLLDLHFCRWCAENLENSLQHEDVPF